MSSPRFNAAKIREDVALSSRICDTYQPTDGCPPLNTHWGGAPLSGSGWLREFAEGVAGDPLTAEAWKKLEQSTKTEDLSFLIELVYLYTVRKKTLVDSSRESNRVLKAALDSIVPVYDKLIDSLAGLIESSEAKEALTYHRFTNELSCLVAGRKHADEVRKNAAHWGSEKTEAREWYLFLMADTVKRAAREQCVEVLLSLIEASRKAHGEKTGLLQAETLAKRIRRAHQRMRPLYYLLASTPLSDQTNDDDDDIPF